MGVSLGSCPYSSQTALYWAAGGSICAVVGRVPMLPRAKGGGGRCVRVVAIGIWVDEGIWGHARSPYGRGL